MNTTLVRRRTLSAMIVGASGMRVLRVVSAFEGQRITTVRAETVAEACDRLALDMPRAVLLFVAPETAPERVALEECALAVGALVVHIAPGTDDAALQTILERTIVEVLERHGKADSVPRPAVAPVINSDVPPGPVTEVVDEGESIELDEIEELEVDEGWDQ